MKIIAYSILVSNSEEELSADVCKHIETGYQPYGSMNSVCPVLDGVPAPLFSQAVVRYEGTVVPPGSLVR